MRVLPHAAKLFRHANCMGLLFALSIAQSSATYAQLGAREILEQVEDAQRSTTNSAFNRIQLSSCQFGVRKLPAPNARG